jgi:DNA-binding NarL/FixJ family response regulator
MNEPSKSNKLSSETSQPLPSSPKATVYLIDDHPMIVKGITLLIDAEADMKVIGSASVWTVALKEIQQLKPDVVLLDVTLANANGIEVLKNLKVHVPEQKVLMLSMHDENLYAVRAMKAGASGYLMKATATDEVPASIRQVLKGEVYLSVAMSKRMMSQLVGHKTTDQNPLTALSDRELEVYQMVGDGLTTRQIADRLFLSVKTIETHKTHLKEKLHLASANELTKHAIGSRP